MNPVRGFFFSFGVTLFLLFSVQGVLSVVSAGDAVPRPADLGSLRTPLTA